MASKKGYGSQKNDWRRKKNWKATHGHQTPGNQKGENCKASTNDRYCAFYSRAYKNPCYAGFVAKTKKWNPTSYR